MAQVGTGLSAVPSSGANLIAAGISGGSNIITGVINSALQAGSSHQNRVLARWQTNQQLEENQRSRDWSSLEAEKARLYDWKVWNDQKEFDREMFEKTLPENQVLNLLKAGINPAAYFNQSGAQSTPAVANGSPAGSPMPSASTAGVQSSNPGITTAPVFDSIFGGFADFLKKLAEAKKLGVETEGLEKMIPEQLKNWLLQNKNLEVTNEIQQFNANILPKIKNQELKNLAAEWEKKMSEVALSQSETDLNEWKSMTEQFQQKLLDEKSGLTRFERMIAEKQLPYISRQMESTIEANRAFAEKSRAEASQAREQAKTISDLRGWQVGFQQATTELAQVDSYVKRNTMWEQVESYLGELRAKEMLPEQVEQAIINAKKSNDWFVLNQLLGVVNTGVRAYGAYKGAKTDEGIVNAQDVRNSIQQDYNDYLREKDGFRPSSIKGFGQ